MTRYIKVTDRNSGLLQVRLEPNAYIPGDKAVLVDITEDPQPFDDGRAEHLLNTYPRQVEEVDVDDVPDEFLAASDRPGFVCENCNKPYRTKSGLTRHVNSVHGPSLL